VHVQEEGRVEVRVVLGEELGFVDNLVTALLGPLVDAMYVSAARDVERDVLQTDAMA
jgi:hypothetical protein